MGSGNIVSPVVDQQFRIEQPPIRSPQYGGEVFFDPVTNRVLQQFIFSQSEGLESMEELVLVRMKLKHPNFITVSRYNVPVINGTCGAREPKLQLEYQYVNFNLDQLIKECRWKKELLQEDIFKKIFRQVASVLDFLESNNTCHGDIKPENIIMRNIETPVLIDSYFVNKGKISYQLVLSDSSCESLLAPEQLELMRMNMPHNLQLVHKSEVFALGLTMFATVTKIPPMECYQLNQMRVKQPFIDSVRPHLIKLKYSVKTSNLISACMAMDPRLRPSFKSIMEQLSD